MDEIVLSWQIEDICNEDIYRDKVKKIPDEFHSVDAYLQSYTLPLIEETRAELFSCLESISECPYAKIRDIELRNTKNGPVCHMDILANGFSGGTEIYEPKNGDVFVLSSLKPESTDDLLRYGESYCFAIVKKVVEVKEVDENNEVTLKRFAMSVSPNTSAEEIEKCTCSIFLMNTVTNSRIWQALHDISVDNNFTLVEKVLSRNRMEQSISHITQEQDDSELSSFNLNESQMEALKSTISAVKCKKSSSIKLVWGPPGTGKTKVVGSILWSLNKLHIRTLTCAPTNVAVAGVCSRLVQLLKNSNSDAKNSNSDRLPPSSLADVVLFGNRGRMDISGDLEDVFLDSRVSQLENCYSSLFGVPSMIRLLEDCVNEYDEFVENSKKDGKPSLVGFGDYLREQFNELEKNLNDCFLAVFIHLPRRFLSPENFASIFSLQDLLREFGNLLLSRVITEEQLKHTFHETPSALSLSTAQEKLIEAREECLKQLRYIQEKLKLSISSLKKGGSVRDLCLENANLVFCTASSSFTLHNAQKSCFDVVIIDEAAQLKECESVIPLRLNCVKHALLVGDELQLPALVQSKVSKTAGFGRSLFERLVSLEHEKHLLNTQYRMHPSISLFPKNRFYDGKILDGPNVLADGYNNEYSHLMFGSYAFVNIADGREEKDDVGKSWRNWVEVAVVSHLIKSLYESWNINKGKITIGIVSPYAAQVRAMKDRIGKKYHNASGFEVRVKSIDGFQGQEDDVIILSTVRCNTKGSVGFMYDNQRTNVAITRAWHCLWIVGSATTLSKSGTIWSDIVLDAQQRGCLFDAKDNEDLSKSILNVKNELNPNSVVFSSTRWKVLFSDEFLRSFARLKSRQTRMGLIQMLLRLASGWRSKRRNLSMDDCSFPRRVYGVGELYLVWSVDLEKDQRVYTQIIKLWDVIPLAEVKGLLKRVDYIFSMYTDAYMERCKTIRKEGTIEVPMMWTDGHEIVQYRKNIQPDIQGENQEISGTSSSFLENSEVSESLVLMRFYALSSGVVKHLLMSCDGSEIDIPFELNDHEMEIIRFPYTSFILGRSGTGKTTVLTTKLVRMEQQFFVASHGMGHSDPGPSGVVQTGQENDPTEEEKVEIGFIKQAFLTVSPNLCSAIRGQVNRLVRFANFGELSGPLDCVTMHDAFDKLDDFADIPDNFDDLTETHYPLIITFRKFLMMLDGTIRSSFFNKFYTEWGVSIEGGVSRSRTLQTLIESKEVDFDKFSGSYWPHFNEQVTKNLDASTVFTQIVSHIKGGFGCIEGGALGREKYVSLSEKRSSSLSTAVRERVYDIFLEYEKKKRAAREFDLSDFVNNLHTRINTDGYLGSKIDFIYIDEVQDLTLGQISLLKHVCNNFKEGFVFAGDTAQTIARGVDFRFEDIRSLFYNEFLSELKGKEKEKETRLSDMFQLCQNFRTHIGVLQLAQSVIDLLYYFFPFSVDKLKPETSLIYGDAPVLLESGGGDENAIIKIFGGSQSSGGRTTEFGAEQVILVRDNSVKREILEITGKRAVVLTIIECKGLEFQDVLLYNFFGSSPLANKWRVLYEYLEKEDILDPSMTRSYPKFDITSHYLLCSELKQLYVAITRTRQRLWICENSKEICKPIFDYWKKLFLVRETQLDTNFVEAMQTASTPDDWRVRGMKLFNERQFEMARICFEKAGDVYNENWARAAGLVERAERDSFANSGNYTALYKAAEIYETIGKYDKAATCYVKLHDYAKAATVYLEKCDPAKLEDAGDCFEMIKCWPRAAEVYFQAKCFSKCISACSKGELFDMGLKYLEKWRLEEEKNRNKREEFQGLDVVREDFIKSCADHFHLRGDYKKMMHFVKALRSMVQIRSFLMSKRLLDELLTLELEADNFVEAARIARLKEDLLLEAEVWEKAGSFEKATRLVILDVIMKSLWSHGSKGWPPKSFPKSEVQFKKAKDLAKKVSSGFYNSVCSELYLWDGTRKTLSKSCKLLFEAEKSKNVRLEYLSLRFLLDLHLAHAKDGYLFETELFLDAEKSFHEKMACDRVSFNTLVYSWVRWKEAVTKVSSSLHEEFCCDYLGVRRENNKEGYCVLNPGAYWIENSVRALLKKCSSRFLMSSNRYTSCATSYWKREMLSVGTEVVEKLDSLLRSSSHKLKTLSPETRGRISLSVYEVIKSLKQSTGNGSEDGKFQRCISSVEEWFWDAIFPLDSKNRATEAVLSILDCPIVADLVDESLDRILSRTSGKLTYGQLGRLSMLLLLSGKLPDDLLGKVAQSTENKPEWWELFASFKVLFDCGCFERKSLVVKFEKALRATYEVNWREEVDYMSPHCYLYLLDLLTFFASSCLGSVGYMITTRSMLAEIMKLKGCKSFLDSPLEMVPEAATSTGLLSLFEFIVSSLKQLLCNKSEMLQWIQKCSHPLLSNLYPQMVLRLAITLNLAYLNMGLDIYSGGNFLLGLNEISCDLPWQFSRELSQALCNRKRDRSLIAIVDAFASVGDPLVVISAKLDSCVFPPSSNSFFFFSDEMRDKDHIMSVLFPKVIGPDVHSTVTVKKAPKDVKEGQGNEQERLVKMLGAFQGHEKRNAEETVSMDILRGLLSWLHQNKPRKGFYDQLLEEINSVHGHFEELTVSLVVRCKEEHTYPTLQDLYLYWKDGEAKLNLIIDTLVSEKNMRKEDSERKPKDLTIAEEKKIVATTAMVKKEVEETSEQDEELYWEELEAFLQRKVDVKSVVNLLSAVVSLFDQKKFARSFDAQFVAEMKSVYNSFSDLPISCRGSGPTLEDLYSKWPHGEIKLKLIIDAVLLTSHKEIVSHDIKEGSSRSRADATSKMVKEKAPIEETGAGSSSQPNKKNNPKPKKKSNKGRRKNRN